MSCINDMIDAGGDKFFLNESHGYEWRNSNVGLCDRVRIRISQGRLMTYRQRGIDCKDSQLEGASVFLSF